MRGVSGFRRAPAWATAAVHDSGAGMSDDADRIDRLEMRLAEQDRVIEDLDATVTAQWAAIEGLRRQVSQFVDRLADAERRLPGEPEAPPPHY